jgi:hypothetical protein
MSLDNAFADVSVFHLFKQHSTHETFARAWHPLLPALAQVSRTWRHEALEYWRKKMQEVERRDVATLYWLKGEYKPQCLLPLSLIPAHKVVGEYRCLHAYAYEYYTFQLFPPDDVGILWAIATCFLYNWPEMAFHIAAYNSQVCARADLLTTAPIGAICFKIATATRSPELIDLACNLFSVSTEDARWAVTRMCAYNHKGIAIYLVEKFALNVDDLRFDNNYALFHAVCNNCLAVVQWLLRMFSFTRDEVLEVLRRAEHRMPTPELTAKVRETLDEFLDARRVDATKKN